MEQSSQQETPEPALYLILAEAELELVPDEILTHPAVTNNASQRGKAPSELLLDSSLHHAAMRKLNDSQRRGRPDIVHRFLLLALDSLASKRGLLQIYVHTWDQRLITVNPEARLPKSYYRFVGLLEQLFAEGEIKTKDGSVLLSMEDKRLENLFKELDASPVLLWEGGEDVPVTEFCEKKKAEKLALVVGGFPHGDFKTTAAFVEERLSLGEEHYTAPTIAAKLIFGWEESSRLSGEKN